MKSLGEIYWDIDHECLHSVKTISLMDESTMLFHAAEEYVEELLKFGDRWKSIVLHDIDYLNASSIGRSRAGQEGYREGAEIFLSFIYQELERYGLKIDDGDGGDGGYPDIPKELIYLFPSEPQCIDFVKNNYGKPANIVADAYMAEPGVKDPFIRNNSLHVRSTLYHYFVEPFDKSESARTGFYTLFK